MGRENLTQVALLMDSYARFDFINHYAYIIEDTIFGPVGALQALANKEYKSLDMQFFIGNAYRNNGYMQEAIKLFASVLKSTSYYSLLFDISTKNISATNLVVKLGAEAIDGIEQVQYELVI
jgi:lipopolysaccharide biosynthesis regulator YciM